MRLFLLHSGQVLHGVVVQRNAAWIFALCDFGIDKFDNGVQKLNRHLLVARREIVQIMTKNNCKQRSLVFFFLFSKTRKHLGFRFAFTCASAIPEAILTARCMHSMILAGS